VQTSDQHFVASRILASLDTDDQALSRQDVWKQRALGVALALSRDGHFEWEDFRQALLKQLGACRSVGEASWSFCQRWLLALESVVGTAGLVDAGALAELRALVDPAEVELEARIGGASERGLLHLF
jgi:hypothetical protein